jgi:hypothetical protein
MPDRSDCLKIEGKGCIARSNKVQAIKYLLAAEAEEGKLLSYVAGTRILEVTKGVGYNFCA